MVGPISKKDLTSGIYMPHLLDYVIRPVLSHLEEHAGGDGWSGRAPEQLLLATALAESRGDYLQQLGVGPAVGLFQMEPATHDDLWVNYLGYRPQMAEAVRNWILIDHTDALSAANEMGGNLYYSAAMARVHYRRAPAALPAADDFEGIGRYWKLFYNTPEGSGSADKCAALIRAAVRHFNL